MLNLCISSITFLGDNVNVTLICSSIKFSCSYFYKLRTSIIQIYLIRLGMRDIVYEPIIKNLSNNEQLSIANPKTCLHALLRCMFLRRGGS